MIDLPRPPDADREDLQFAARPVTPADISAWLAEAEAEIPHILPGDFLWPMALRSLANFATRLEADLAAALAERDRLRQACRQQNEEICQTLGKALGYPWFHDDQQNFPGSTEADGVCVGDHVAESIADEAAKRLAAALAREARLREQFHAARSAMIKDHIAACTDCSNQELLEVTDCEHCKSEVDSRISAALAATSEPEEPSASYQSRVMAWLLECFGPDIMNDRIERVHRFWEEALELGQSAGCTAEEAHQLVEYVFGRPVGELRQEVGGTLVCLAALCAVHDVDMDAEAERELARVWTKVEKIRAKHAAKPKFSPLPGSVEPPPPPARTVQDDAGEAGHG